MSNVFFCSDHHLGHANILKFEPEHRPFGSLEEMHETLVDRHNSVVGKQDVVWFLGDVCFNPNVMWLLDRFQGQKMLVLGNHDKFPLPTYLKYFRNVVAMKKFDKHLLTHIPVHPNQMHRFAGNVHGHLHSKKVMSPVGLFREEPDERYVNVSVEQIDLTPIPWEQVRSKFNG